MINIKDMIQKHRNKVEEFKAIKNENRRLDIALERRKLEKENIIQKEKDMLRSIKTKRREVKQKEFKRKIEVIKKVAGKFEIKELKQTPQIKQSQLKKVTKKTKKKDNPFTTENENNNVWGFQ